MKLTIIFLGRNGAGPKYAYNMTKALVEYSNIDFQVIIPKNIDNLEDWKILASLNKNLSIELVETYNSNFQFIFSFFNIFNYFNIAKKVKKFNPSYLYMPMGSLLNPGIFLFLKNIKKIYTLHDPSLHLGEESFFIESIRKIEIKNSNIIILLNNRFIDQVSNKYNFNKENIYVIPHAGFFKKTTPIFPEKFQKRILFLGRIEKYKGIDLLIKSFYEALRVVQDLELLIAGRGDLSPYKELLQDSRSKKIKIINHWLTEEEIEQFIHQSDFLLLPYKDASQSGVIPLAFGNGRIVVVTNVGALAEQVPEELGFIAEATVEDIADKIITIYKESIESLRTRDNAAYNYALKNLTWESSAQKLLQTINYEK